MRSALICVFFILTIRKGGGAQGDDFRPTPIPLGEWRHDKQTGRAAGTISETIVTESPPKAAAVPAHYWEDALRHSVYLTLVRDKIDQLIAKADVMSADSDPHKEVSKEVDDHNLWEKIKTAPFDRMKEEEAALFGDVTILAKGRLLQENGGFRFIEDDKSKHYCSDPQCMQSVIAVWSVKRVRQRDQETFPGRYHYELTFSVISQTPKKQKKPYENPIRTFTVRESSHSNGISSRPQEYEWKPPAQIHGPRPNRAIWFHKNIVPTQMPLKTHRFDAFDRIFSLFSDDDDDVSYETPAPKYKSNPYQHSKVGYVGAPTDQHSQVNVMHYPYRPQPNKYGRPTPPTSSSNQPPRQHLDIGSISALNSHSYYNPYDYRGESNQGVKTTRPAVLPTPLPPIAQKDQSSEVINSVPFDIFENSTRYPEVTHASYKTTNKYKSTPIKVNYFGDHVRPPIYNAPPGVFVTMDKKPFKPMPPMKLMHSSKPHKLNKPLDFRPSPQVHESQFSEPDPFSDTAFRPISINYSDRNATITDFEFNKKPKNKHRPSGKKPSKKHENTKTNPITTTTPDIITAQSFADEGLEGMDWMSYLGAFSKTTPMSSQTEKSNETEYSDLITTTTTETMKEINTMNIISNPTSIPTLTTSKPKKRTRPPHKFNKQDRIKKLRRVLNSTTTTTTTTIKPRITTKMMEKYIQRKPVQDLTPLASSTPTGTSKSTWESKNFTIPLSTTTPTTTTSKSTTTTTTAAPTTTKASTTTRSVTTTTSSKPSTTTFHPRNRNRFRQSTLLIKGTSVKHDRWSVIGLQKNSTNSTAPPSLNTQSTSSYRRNGSNFHGYSSTVNPKDELKEKQTDVSSESSTTYESYESNSVLPLDYSQNEDEDESDNDEESDEGESSDQSEFIFPASSSTTDKTTEVTNVDRPFLTTVSNVQMTHSQNKTKCKKKKNNLTAEEPLVVGQQIMKKSYNTQVTSENPTTDDIFQDFLNLDFTDDLDKSTRTSSMKLDEQESANHGSYLKIDDDLDDFFGILDENTQRSESSPDDNDYDEDLGEFGEGNRDDDNDSFEEEDTSYNEEVRNNEEPDSKRPLSFLELIAMA